MGFREATADDLNYLVNHPAISKACGVPEGGYVEMAGMFNNPHSFALVSVLPSITGGLLFGYEGDGEYDIHFAFLPGGDTRDMLMVCRAMLNEAFTNRDARVITGRPPRVNRAVRVIGSVLGFRKLHNSGFTNSLGDACDVYELRM